MITTIQIREEVKHQLDKIKQTQRQTYEEVIVNLINSAELQRRRQDALLREGYKEMAKESLKITKEWETTDATLNWEW